MVTTIGLDIGSSAVRAVQVSTRRGTATLDRLGQVTLPPGAVRDGEIVDADAVVVALKQLWTQYKLKSRKVALGVANQQVVVRQIDVPYLPEKELRASLQFQVQDQIPIALDHAVLDYHVLDEYENEAGDKFSRLMLVAAQRDMIDSLLDVVERAKLTPVGLDLYAFAVLRSLAPERVLSDHGGQLLIDVGSSVTNIMVHHNGVPSFVRILLMGGNSITEALVSALGLTHEDAEAAKAGFDADGISGDAVSGLISERINRLVDEIRGSVDYYKAQTDAVSIDAVMLSGGGSLLRGLQERLESTLGLPVDRGRPLQDLQVGKVGLDQDQLGEAEPYMAVAVGLAMGGVQ